MGIKSNRKIESYYNYFSASGLDAVGAPPVMEVGWYGDRGVWGGGHQGGVGDKNTLDYINIINCIYFYISPSTHKHTTITTPSNRRSNMMKTSIKS